MSKVWGFELYHVNVVEVHVSRLRNKIDRDFSEHLLHTVRGCGYVLRVGEG